MKEKTIVGILCLLLLNMSCGYANKEKNKEYDLIDNMIKIHIDSTQPVISADEIVKLYNENRGAYEKSFKDSSIFIIGNIEEIDIKSEEVILRNNSNDNYVICVVKDKGILQYLKLADHVLFKGICRVVGGNGLIVIGQCELAQFRN